MLCQALKKKNVLTGISDMYVYCQTESLFNFKMYHSAKTYDDGNNLLLWWGTAGL